MSNDYLEVEVKLLVDDLAAITRQLEILGAELQVPRVFERNVRYENAARDLIQRGIVVRLRQDERTRLTYKEPGTLIDGIMRRFEAEVEVNDFATMDLILNKLAYKPEMVYEKFRTTYALAGSEIMLDELPFGPFVEIEGEPTQIDHIMHQLDLQDKPRIARSYVDVFAHLRQHLNLTFADLTFDNFKDIDVPASMLRSL